MSPRLPALALVSGLASATTVSAATPRACGYLRAAQPACLAR
ncbi:MULTISPECIES: hypothetical protein [Caulobacter]|nr:MULTISPECIES: hypothetical protein [Caulobacter]MDR7232660.1 hypothetical protein [Caulobacter sp. BE264]